MNQTDRRFIADQLRMDERDQARFAAPLSILWIFS
jgi:hypothetical protein